MPQSKARKTATDVAEPEKEKTLRKFIAGVVASAALLLIPLAGSASASCDDVKLKVDGTVKVCLG